MKRGTDVSGKAIRLAEFDQAVWAALTNAFAPNGHAPNGQTYEVVWHPEDIDVAAALSGYISRVRRDPGPETAQEMADLFQFGIPEAPGAAADRIKQFVKRLPQHEAAVFRKQPTPPPESFSPHSLAHGLV